MTRRRMALAFATATLATTVPATAQPTPASDAAEEPIPITDPVLLESMGFEPDTTNVYAMPQVLREMAMDPAERAAAQATPEDIEPLSPFGTSTWGYSPVLANEFFPNDSSSEYQTSISERHCSSGNPYFTAQIESLPHGAKLQFVSLWFFDSSATQDFEFTLIRLCQPDNSGALPSTTLLRTALSPGSGGHQYLRMGSVINPIDETIDLESCAYSLRVRFGDPPPSSCTGGPFLRIQKGRAEWTRQISPAPAIATFDDVPTGHPFFRHIEALAASGITGGCGADSYCPNSPLTRGQMAVFLATALGLHWDHVEQ